MDITTTQQTYNNKKALAIATGAISHFESTGSYKDSILIEFEERWDALLECKPSDPRAKIDALLGPIGFGIPKDDLEGINAFETLRRLNDHLAMARGYLAFPFNDRETAGKLFCTANGETYHLESDDISGMITRMLPHIATNCGITLTRPGDFELNDSNEKERSFLELLYIAFCMMQHGWDADWKPYLKEKLNDLLETLD